MDVPSSLPTTCPNCDEETFGRVLKGRVVGKSVKAVVKCLACGHAHDVELKIPKQRKVRTIISHGEESEKTDIDLSEDWTLKVGDEIMVGDICVQITGIESGGKRLGEAKVPDIGTLWTRYFNEIMLKIAINKGRKTLSEQLIVKPEEEIAVGETIQVGQRSIKVYKIKVGNRVIHRAGAKAMAKNIVRVYGKTAGRW